MNQPLLILDQYSHDKVLWEAWDDAFALVDQNDWICFKDGDSCWLEMSDFGHVLGEYIAKYPKTGLFTCYASRCHYSWQSLAQYDQCNMDVLYWAHATLQQRKAYHLQVETITANRIAGHLCMIQKRTWETILPVLMERLVKNPKHILGFDTQMSRSIKDCGFDIKLMKGMLLFHPMRLFNNDNKKLI